MIWEYHDAIVSTTDHPNMSITLQVSAHWNCRKREREWGEKKEQINILVLLF